MKTRALIVPAILATFSLAVIWASLQLMPVFFALTTWLDMFIASTVLAADADVDWALAKQASEPGAHSAIIAGEKLGDLTGASAKVLAKLNA